MQIPTDQDISRAEQRLEGRVHRTPVMRNDALNRLSGADVFLKCENFQKTGAFKIRGATNAVMELPDNVAARGVATHSSGNHAAAVALAARRRGCPARVVMPNNVAAVKQSAVRGYGADVRLCEPTLPARESELEKVVAETGATFIPPYNHPLVVAGQATATCELLSEVPGLDIVLTPIGGGGLTGGAALATRYRSPSTRVIAVEPKAADDAFRSFKEGRVVPSVAPDTIADGLLTSLGDLTFEILQKYVHDVVTVSEEEIASATLWMWERTKLVIEPSAAVPVALLLRGEGFGGQRVGVILSGGNVDFTALEQLWRRIQRH